MNTGDMKKVEKQFVFRKSLRCAGLTVLLKNLCGKKKNINWELI